MVKFDEKNYLDIEKIIRDSERVLYKDNINEEYSHDELGNAHSAPTLLLRRSQPRRFRALRAMRTKTKFRSPCAEAEPDLSARACLFAEVLCWTFRR